MHIINGWIFGTLEQNQKSTDFIKMPITKGWIFGTLEQNQKSTDYIRMHIKRAGSLEHLNKIKNLQTVGF